MADPNIISKSGEVRQSKRILTVREREGLLQAELAHREILNANEQYASADGGAKAVSLPGLRVNRAKLSEQQKQISDTLKNFSPEPIAESERDKYVKRAKYLEEQFAPVLETRAELTVMRRDKPEWASATRKARMRIEGNDGNGKKVDYEGMIEEWRSIQRRLDPENPDADNLHMLRKDR